MAVRREVDLVLIQKLRSEKERDSTCSHPSFMFIRGDESVAAKCWIAVNWALRCQMTKLKDLAREYEKYVQVMEVVSTGAGATVIANVYDRHEGSKANRPSQRAAWGEMAKHRRVIIAGDMNAHSKMWDPQATYSRNYIFWERLIDEEELFMWKTEEAMRMGISKKLNSYGSYGS